MSNQFIPIDRDQPMVIPVQEWLAEDHLARFIVEIVESLDVTPLEAAYHGGGSALYPPKMMLALLFYGYATGIFSSRALERATYELIPVIYLTGNTHPDHNSINTFLLQCSLCHMNSYSNLHLFSLFTNACRQNQVRSQVTQTIGNVSLDGSKVRANASKHKVMSWDYANRLEEQLQAEVEALLQQAEAGNTEPVPGLSAILNGRAAVTPEMALRLEMAFGVSAESWLGHQMAYDLWQAEQHRHELTVTPLGVGATRVPGLPEADAISAELDH